MSMVAVVVSTLCLAYILQNNRLKLVAVLTDGSTVRFTVRGDTVYGYVSSHNITNINIHSTGDITKRLIDTDKINIKISNTRFRFTYNGSLVGKAVSTSVDNNGVIGYSK